MVGLFNSDGPRATVIASVALWDPVDDPQGRTDATETISYQMPAFTLGGALVYFAAFKHHMGFYPCQ